MNILFACSRNKWRSATAEAIYKNHPEHQVRSVGTEPSARTKINTRHLLWADVIFVMEKKHKQRILEKFSFESSDKEMIILDIPDNYQFMDEELIEEIRAKVEPYF